MPLGTTRATTDPRVAKQLATARLAELTARVAASPSDGTGHRRFRQFAAHHLASKAIAGVADTQWLASAELHLETASAYFGALTDLADITVLRCTEYMTHISQLPNGRSGVLSRGSVTHYLNSLSSLFRRAISETILPLGANPIAAMVSKPKITRRKTPWLELPEMAEILAFAKRYVPDRPDLAIPFSYEIIAGYAYTGLRESELLGLEIGDVDLERRVIHVQENSGRRLETESSERDLPIPTELLVT